MWHWTAIKKLPSLVLVAVSVPTFIVLFLWYWLDKNLVALDRFVYREAGHLPMVAFFAALVYGFYLADYL